MLIVRTTWKYTTLYLYWLVLHLYCTFIDLYCTCIALVLVSAPVLTFIMLYWFVLTSIDFYWFVLVFVLTHIVFYWLVLVCIDLYWFALSFTGLYWLVLHRTDLYCILLTCIDLYCFEKYIAHLPIRTRMDVISSVSLSSHSFGAPLLYSGDETKGTLLIHSCRWCAMHGSVASCHWSVVCCGTDRSLWVCSLWHHHLSQVNSSLEASSDSSIRSRSICRSNPCQCQIWHLYIADAEACVYLSNRHGDSYSLVYISVSMMSMSVGLSSR